MNRNGELSDTSEFPILCNVCLGDNKNIRMIKNVCGSECKVCERPFTVFRWCPGTRMRFKKTEICRICAKLKVVCQTCLLDLKYNLPVALRDSIFRMKTDPPPNIKENKQFYDQCVSLDSEKQGIEMESYELKREQKEILEKLSRKEVKYKRNLPHVCSFYLKGKCNRGGECPYRHEIDINDEQLNDQNIKDRYYGVNDPVAIKMLDKIPKLSCKKPPEELAVRTILISSLETGVDEEALREFFYSFGEIESVKVENTKNNKTALIKYTNQQSAEDAIDKTVDGVKINNVFMKVNWAKKSMKIISSRFHKEEYQNLTQRSSNIPLKIQRGLGHLYTCEIYKKGAKHFPNQVLP